MAHRFSSRLTSLLLRHHTTTTTTTLHHHYTTASAATSLLPNPFLHPNFPFTARFLSTRSTRRPNKPDIQARARQLQTRRLWSYALAFSCAAGFVVLGLNQFQDQLVFYITPSEALEQYAENPSKAKFRLGGLVLESSVAQIPTSTEMQFVITDLLSDMVVKYEGALPDLFREGHSVVVEGVFMPFTDEMKETELTSLGKRSLEVTAKARSLDLFFSAREVLAKHDEKYMPQEIAAAIEKNKKLLAEQEEERRAARDSGGAATATA